MSLEDSSIFQLQIYKNIKNEYKFKTPMLKF